MDGDWADKPEYVRDRRDLWCWHCHVPISDESDDCRVCLWRRCACGACRQPTHIDTRDRMGPCAEEVKRLGPVLRAWDETFDGRLIEWPPSLVAAEHALTEWLWRFGRKSRLRLELLRSRDFHPAFGMRIQVESEVDLLRDPRIPGLLRSASNFSGRRDSMVEKTNGDRVTYVQGEGVFARVGGRRLDLVDVREPEHLEALERSRMPLEAVYLGDE